MRALPLLLLSCLVAACGQTGDLYLPQKTPPASAPPSSDEANKKKGEVPAASQPDPQPVPQDVR